MTGPGFDALTRQLGRRHVLQALGAAAVTTASGLTLVSAKNGKSNNANNPRKNRKNRQKVKKQALALCKGQVEQCNALIVAQCADDAECVATGQQCCPFLGTCDFAGLLACLPA